MDGGEILGGKLIGAFWGMRWLGLLYAGFLALGLAAGAIHPLAGAYSALLTASFLGFVAALGITASLRSRSSVAALAATMLALLALNALPICCGSLSDPLWYMFVSPLVLGLGLASYDDVDRFVHGGRPLGFPPAEIAVGLLFSLVFHGASALALLSSCLARFDREAGRPIRDNPLKRAAPIDLEPE
jgi:hypothetical protein